MSVVTGIAIYFVIWWTVLFAVLPWGSRPADDPQVGTADSAPARPRIALKFLATTIVSAVIFAAAWAVLEYGGFSLRDMVHAQ